MDLQQNTKTRKDEMRKISLNAFGKMDPLRMIKTVKVRHKWGSFGYPVFKRYIENIMRSKIAAEWFRDVVMPKYNESDYYPLIVCKGTSGMCVGQQFMLQLSHLNPEIIFVRDPNIGCHSGARVEEGFINDNNRDKKSVSVFVDDAVDCGGTLRRCYEALCAERPFGGHHEAISRDQFDYSITFGSGPNTTEQSRLVKTAIIQSY